MRKHQKLFSIMVALTVGVLFAGSASAALMGELGILDTSGINPATGAAWQQGDQYRLTFLTSERSDAVSSDIATYNAWVQGLADTAGLGAATWNVIGSTATVDARDNTSTNPTVDGTGHAMFLMDGSTVVASNYADLWDGEIQNIINLSEQNGAPASTWPITGTALDGTAAGQFGPLGSGGDVQQGNSNSTTQWIWRTWTGSNSQSMYGMSDPLTVIPEPASLALLMLAGGAGFMVRRRFRR